MDYSYTSNRFIHPYTFRLNSSAILMWLFQHSEHKMIWIFEIKCCRPHSNLCHGKIPLFYAIAYVFSLTLSFNVIKLFTSLNHILVFSAALVELHNYVLLVLIFFVQVNPVYIERPSFFYICYNTASFYCCFSLSIISFTFLDSIKFHVSSHPIKTVRYCSMSSSSSIFWILLNSFHRFIFSTKESVFLCVAFGFLIGNVVEYVYILTTKTYLWF